MKLAFASKKNEGGSVVSFTFKPLEPVSWAAGQSIRLEIPNGYDTEERRFSISSAPYEGVFTITTRISDSSFKQSLDRLSPGAVIEGHNIEGDFIWQPAESRHVFIAGGVGITPFRAMLKQRIHENQPIKAMLLYSNSDNDAIFKQELDEWQQKFPEFTVRYFSSRVSLDVILQHAEGLIYISGATQTVRQLTDALADQGFPIEAIRQDLFTGRVS